MGVPAIKLNLAPPPTLWRLHHGAVSWAVLAIGAIGFGLSFVATVRAYQEADRAGQMTVAITDRAKEAQTQQAKVMDDLREVNVDQEMPRWRLAERILMERALPWSRITAELERSLVQDVRIKSVQRTRGADQTVQLKLRGESRNPDAEAEFIVSLQQNLAFAHVILDREAEMSSKRGSLEFDYSLLLNTEPPPYEPLPKYGPERKPGWVEPAPEPPPPEPKQEKPVPAPAPQPPPQQQVPEQQPFLPAPEPRERPRPARRLPGARSLDNDRDGRDSMDGRGFREGGRRAR
jgi:hypothetical protein